MYLGHWRALAVAVGGVVERDVVERDAAAQAAQAVGAVDAAAQQPSPQVRQSPKT